MSDTGRMQNELSTLTAEIARLRARSAEHRAQRAAVAPELIAEMEAQCEALAVAEEELRVQVEELARMAVARDADRQRYRDLFDFAPDAYFVADLSGVVVHANTAACELTGFSGRFLPGKPLATIIDREQVGRFRELVGQVTRAQRVEAELTVRGRRPIGVRVAVVGTLSSDRRRVLWMVRPLSEPERREVARAELVEALAREKQARTELEASIRAKDHFLAVLAHDMRSPVMAIDGWATVLRRPQLTPESRELALTTIEHSARAQAGLVAELFDLSRLGSHKLRLDLGPFDLGDAARRCLEAVRPIAHVKGVLLTVEVDLDAGPVRADALRMDRVVTNLVTNAIKFTPPGGQIRLEVRRMPGAVELVVRDTGCGIPPEELEHVFDCFTQGATESGGSAGLGLGLYISQQIVEIHRGQITAESPGVGCGATFRVRLPVHRPEVMLPPTSLTPRPAESRALQALRVLVLEDDVDARSLITSYLESLGAEVCPVEDVDAALAAFDAFAPDVLISDLEGEVDLGRLTDALRDGRHGDVTSVALASNAEPRERAELAGFDLQLTKPVDPAQLVQVMTEARAGRQRS